MIKKKKLLGIITREVVRSEEEATALQIAELMKNNDIGVVVITKGDEIKGVVSERDIARRIVAENKDPGQVIARDFMTTNVFSVEIRDGLNKIYQTLCQIKFRHLLILDNGKLVGITSRRDLLDGLSTGRNNVV